MELEMRYVHRGLFTGGALLLNLLGYAAEESYALDLGLLSTFVIDVVSKADPVLSWTQSAKGWFIHLLTLAFVVQKPRPA
jgi:hypothetical protein